MDPRQIIDFLNAGGALGLCVFVGVLVARGDLILRREGDELRRQRDAYKDQVDAWQRLALRGNSLAERSVELADILAKSPD